MGSQDGSPERGQTYVAAQWPGCVNPEIRLLTFAAWFRVFTPGQAARAVWGGDVSAASEGVGRLVRLRRWLSAFEVKMPAAAGGGTAVVYHLTKEGAAAIGRVRGLKKTLNGVRAGKPQGALLDRVVHDVYVTEAYLYLCTRFVSTKFVGEDHLKAAIVGQRQGGGVEAGAGTPEATADFQLTCVRAVKPYDEFTVSAEVSTEKMSTAQILAKPHDLWWFTYDKKHASKLKHLTGERVTLLGDPRLPEKTKGENKASGREDEGGSERRAKVAIPTPPDHGDAVIEALEAHGGAATTDAVACFLGLSPNTVRPRLTTLECAGVVASVEATLRPGLTAGRPSKLYYRPRVVEEMSVDDSIVYLSASEAAVRLAEEGYVVRRSDCGAKVVELHSQVDALAPPLLLLIDDLRVRMSALRERLRELADANPRSPVALVVTEQDRAGAVAEQSERVFAVDFTSAAKHVEGVGRARRARASHKKQAFGARGR